MIEQQTTMSQTSIPNDLTKDDYCVFGLATCFIRDEGEISQVEIIEPIPSAALQALLKGIPTSYHLACALPIGQVLSSAQPSLPDAFGFKARLADDFFSRTIAAARTYKQRPEAQSHIQLGEVKTDFNYSLTPKRVLNTLNVVQDEDNVRQHSHTHKVL